jgi:hypothetical protein
VHKYQLCEWWFVLKQYWWILVVVSSKVESKEECTVAIIERIMTSYHPERFARTIYIFYIVVK